MARQFDVQYVGGYMYGSTAYKVEAPKPRKAARKHIAKQNNKRIVLRIDPLAIVGTMVACVMLVLLAVGFRMLLEEYRVRSNWARVGGGCNLTLWSSTSGEGRHPVGGKGGQFGGRGDPGRGWGRP